MSTIWRAWAPAKHKFFAWLLAQKRIMTADRLLARQWPNSYFCPLCRRNLETAVHLMLQCPWTVSLWDLAANKFQLPALSPSSWRGNGTMEVWPSELSAVPATAKRARSLVLLLIWEIWRERNDRIFRNVEHSPASVLFRADEERISWALAGGRHLMMRE